MDDMPSTRGILTIVGLWLALVGIGSLLFKWYLVTHIVRAMGGDW